MADDATDPSAAGISATGNAWYLRTGSLPRGRWEVRCHLTDDHPDGATVDGTALAPPELGRYGDDTVVWRAGLDDARRVRVEVSDWAAPGAPDVWCVLLREHQQGKEQATLVAFCTDDLPNGTVLPDASFFTMPVRNNQQVAAVRWWRDTAVVHQIYSHPEHRRSHLATKVIYAASGIHQLHGWPGRLHSDGRRTDEGQQFATGLRHPGRIATWTERARIVPE
ncbi:MAG: hypothetical protein ACXIVQ_04020 [Acidimicrobiales bacterium]